MIFLLISMLVKQFIFHSEFNEYAVEFIAFFGASIYIVIRNIFIGNNLYEENRLKKMALVVNGTTAKKGYGYGYGYGYFSENENQSMLHSGWKRFKSLFKKKHR